MLNKINKIYFALGIMALPIFTFAAEVLGKTKTLFQNVQTIVSDVLIPLVFTLALLLFFWGVVKYIWSAGDKEEGKKIMIWGVVALAVMTCIWGLVSFIGTELGLENQGDISIPTIGT